MKSSDKKEALKKLIIEGVKKEQEKAIEWADTESHTMRKQLDDSKSMMDLALERQEKEEKCSIFWRTSFIDQKCQK